MSKPRPPVRFHREWEPDWATKHLLWVFFVTDPDEAKLHAVAKELAPTGFLSTMFSGLAHTMTMMTLARFDQEALDAEILRVDRVCARHGLGGVVSIDMDEPGLIDHNLN